MEEAKAGRDELSVEERRLSAELKEIKRVNELIGRRYFLNDES